MAALRQDRIGRYELLIELGRGGMAELFLGRLHGAGGFEKLVAIKRILPHLAQDPHFKEMFLNEARIAAYLSHPNVCQVFELDESDEELFLAMEYLDGVSWEHLIATSPRMRALHLTAGVIGQAAEGLHYAHTLRDVEGKPTPVIHRDVSPQNLFVTVDGVCKVLDFGVSKMMTDGPRTRSGVIKGKLPYMAPEQIRGEDVDARADVFALGVCTWEALAAARLFDRPTDFMIWKAITEEDTPPIARHWPECPPAVDALVRRALDRDRDQRPASARAFAEELRAAAGGASSTAEVSQAVRSQCGERLATRARQVATAVSARRSAIPDRDAAATLDDAVSMQLRLQSHKLARPTEEAAETRDLGPRTAASTSELDAAETNHLPPKVRQLEPDAAATVDGKGTVRVELPDDSFDLIPAKRPLKAIVVTVLAAAAIAAAIVVYATSRSPAPRVEVPAEPVRAPVAFEVDAGLVPSIDAAELAPADSATKVTPRARPKEPIRKSDLRHRLEDVRDDLQTLKRELAGEPALPGSYTIDSAPYAKIYIDGAYAGVTPIFRHAIAAGPHQIRAVLADGRERSFQIVIEPERELSSGKLSW